MADPNTTSQASVSALYVAWGGRDASAGELAYWTGQIASGTATLASVRAAILADPLGIGHTNDVVTALYQNLGGRAPSAGELAVWRGQIAAGAGFDTVRSAILGDPMGIAHTNAVVTQLYQSFAGRAPTAGELQVWQGNVLAGAGWNDVRHAILADPIGIAQTGNVLNQLYHTYSGRAPTTAEVQVWQGNLMAGAGWDDVRHAILDDAAGRMHTDATVAALYQTFEGRAPTVAELGVWEANVRAGSTFDDVRHALLADPAGASHTGAIVSQMYQAEFARAPAPGELAAWQKLVDAGVTFDTLLDTLIADRGSGASGTQRLVDTMAADTFAIGHGHDTVIVGGFDPLHDVLALSGTDVASGNPFDAAHARQVYALDGTADVLLTLDDGHHVLIQHAMLADLGAGNVHLA